MVAHSEGVTKAVSVLINKGSLERNHCPQGQQAQPGLYPCCSGLVALDGPCLHSTGDGPLYFLGALWP